MPLTRISIDVSDSSVLPLLFLRSWAFFQAVILVTYVVANSIWSYDKLDLWHIIHILGFITANFLPICLKNMATLAVFQALIWVRVGIGKFLFVYVLKTFLPQNYMFWVNACILVTPSSIMFHNRIGYYNGLKWASRRTGNEWHKKIPVYCDTDLVDET